MSFAQLKEESVHLFNGYPFLTAIHDELEYRQALKLVEELLEDDVKYEVLIELLSNEIAPGTLNSIFEQAGLNK